MENVKQKHPIQPLEVSDNGTVRFKRNAIVDHLLDVGQSNGFGMNEIASMNFSKDDRQQFAQLIGYSLGGYGELPYVDDDAYGAADTMADEGISEDKSRILYLERELKKVRKSLCEPMARLFGVHPDDLRGNI